MAEEKNQEVETTKVVTNNGGFGGFMDTVSKHGFWKTLYGIVLFVFFSIGVYIAANPAVVFERYDKYVSDKHNASIDYRMESSPIIRAYLNQLVSETGAERAYILEFHNGKSNPSGLQWQFGDLTFINDGTDDISDEIQNVSLSRYNFANVVYQNGYWIGSIEELVSIDERFYNRMRLNGGTFFAFQMIYGANMREIGILGISYIDGTTPEKKSHILSVMHKYASTISPLLDEESVKNGRK